MKKTALILSSIVGLTGAAFAQQVTFRAEIDAVTIFGEALALDRAAAAERDVSGFGFFVSAGDFASFTDPEFWGGFGSAITPEELDSIIGRVAAQPGFANVGVIGRTPMPAPAGAGILNATLNAGAAGFHPVFIIHDSATGVEGLGLGSNIGIVTSDFQTLALGTQPIGLLTAPGPHWDTALLGEMGSLQLATVIPEPRVYAALFGLFALGFVMWRRRNR